MKYIPSLFIALLVFSSVPVEVSALSCMDPAGMLEQYVEQPEYIIFTGVAGETEEFLTPNGSVGLAQSGYVAQRVIVDQVYKGSIPQNVVVNHEMSEVWGYMCASGPIDEGEMAVFIATESKKILSGLMAVDAYNIHSTFAVNLLNALPASGETKSELTREEKRAKLAAEIRELIVLIRQKLAEWRALGE